MKRILIIMIIMLLIAAVAISFKIAYEQRGYLGFGGEWVVLIAAICFIGRRALNGN